MSAASRGAIGIIVGATLTAVACGLWPTFPDDGLHPPRDGGLDAATDLGEGPDTPPPDGAPGDDAGTVDAEMDAGLDDAGGADGADGAGGIDGTGGPGDANGADGTVEAGDAVAPGCGATDVPAGANACDFVPHDPVCSTRIATGVPGGSDLAFNGAGQLAIGAGNAVSLLDRGAASTLFMDLPGNVTALRYTTDGHLVMVTSGTGDGGDLMGTIEVGPAAGGTRASRISTTMRLGGLAVDHANNLYFANTSAGEVRRITATGLLMAAPVATVAAPTLLALNAGETALYVASSVGNVYRVGLAGDDAGTPVQLGGSFVHIAGLAVDTCGNVYVADDATSRIWRIGPAAGAMAVTLVTDVMQPRGLAFGQGGAFDPRVLYTLSGVDGTVRAASVVATGVALPVPMP